MGISGELKDKIIQASLTRKEGEIAEYILNNIGQVCFMSTSDLAKVLGTSNTSVNRTAKALGYTVFSDLQKELREFVVEQSQPDRYLLPPNQRIDAAGETLDDAGLSQRHLDLALANLLSVHRKNPPDKIDRVVELLAASRHRHVNGFRGTADLANKLGFLLRLIVGDVIISTHEEVTSVERLFDSGPEDCAVVLSFNRYSLNAVNVINVCRDRGIKVILITDRATAPFAHLADELLIVDVGSLSYFNSNVAPLYLIELICTKLALFCGDRALQRLDQIEPYLRMAQVLS